MKRAALLLLLLALSGCASTQEVDPYEDFNRKMFEVNRFGDRVLYKPLGKAYQAVIPGFARKGVRNFFDNLTTPTSSLNNFLQGKPGRGFNELARFAFNSTLGVGGLFDIAERGNMPRYDEDFGQTLAVWGLPEGPYLMLPALGPRTALSATAIPVDMATDLLRYMDDTGTRDKLYVLRAIETRARLMGTETVLNQSQDPYIAFREAYLQNRRFNVYDGDPPAEEDFYIFDEDEFSEDEFADEDSALDELQE